MMTGRGHTVVQEPCGGYCSDFGRDTNVVVSGGIVLVTDLFV
jgi:hypothetical protein